jgi:ubiquinone/menaquinone biosynthesis C-methylase UbiE
LQVFFTVLLGYGVACSYKRYVESFDLAGNEVVLDYGSGSGRISRQKVERLLSGKGHTSTFLEYGLRPYKKGWKKYPNVNYKLGDIAALKITASAYDYVVVHFVLHHVEKD